MSNCRDLEVLFASYVDGEAAADQRASVDAHVSRCPPCRHLLAEERAAREVLMARRGGLRSCASTRLRARCAAQRSGSAISSAAPAARLSRRSWVPLSLAATLLLAVGGVFFYSAVNEVEALAAQLALDHMMCFQIGSQASSDPHAAGQGWSEQNGWALRVPASTPDRQLEFVRLRRCLVTEGRAAHMMYRWRGQPLSVYVLPEALRKGVAVEQVVDTFGQEAVMWSSGGRTYVLMARGRRRDMEPIVEYVKANAK
jgi:anti-sigma factor RsiW